MIIEVRLKTCPWCNKVPHLHMPIMDNLYTGETWKWEIRCENPVCTIRPGSQHVSIRKTTKHNLERIALKLAQLATWWNTGNPMQDVYVIKVECDKLKLIK